MDQAAYEQAQNLMVDMHRQIRELGAKVWNARQRGEHGVAHDLELTRDDLRRALAKLKREHTERTR